MIDELEVLIHRLRDAAMTSGSYEDDSMNYDQLRANVESITDMMMREINTEKRKVI